MWRAVLAAGDGPIVEAVTVMVMRTDLRTAKLVHVKTVLHILEVIEARESERPPGKAIASERMNGTGSLVGKGMGKEIVIEKGIRSVIETGIETGRGREKRIKTRSVIAATGTETGTEIETGIGIVTAEMKRIVTETRGKIGSLLVVVLPPLRRRLPPILVIWRVVLTPRGTAAERKSAMMGLGREGVLLMMRYECSQ